MKEPSFLLPKVRKRPRTKATQNRIDDQAFRKWIRTQPSCLSGNFSEHVNGEGRCIAAHVRRAGQSGTAYKAMFSCVPMTDEEHRFQHQHGEAACLTRYGRAAMLSLADPGISASHFAAGWFDEQAAKYRDEWFRMHPEDRP